MELIDIRQVLTQILGFLLMVWILRRYAWGPLIGMLEARREKIAGEFKEVERLKSEAGELKARYDGELRTIEAQARQRITEAVAEGQRVASPGVHQLREPCPHPLVNLVGGQPGPVLPRNLEIHRDQPGLGQPQRPHKRQVARIDLQARSDGGVARGRGGQVHQTPFVPLDRPGRRGERPQFGEHGRRRGGNDRRRLR